MFLSVPKMDLKCFAMVEDREFFSVPVEVVPLYCNILTRFVYVKSPLQGGIVYPVSEGCLRKRHQLTKVQLRDARYIQKGGE